MSQVDNRNSSAAGKRARTDGARREDDWTCPSCGNVNFSFRTTCNMRNCTQPRPADHSAKFGAKPQQTPPAFTSGGYMGTGAPSSMYIGAPPYGSPMFNGTALPPYELPFSGGSGYHYDYGNRLSVGSPYGPLHMSGPPPYSGGSMMGTGGMYGMPPLMDRYGMGMPMGPGSMPSFGGLQSLQCAWFDESKLLKIPGRVGPRPGSYYDEVSQKRNAGRESDWTCPNCGNNNFSFRTVCNMRKCNTPRPGSQASKLDDSKSAKPKMPEGSWKCEKCNNINYPFRTKCNRQNCGAEKPAETNKSGGGASEGDDQVCDHTHREYLNPWGVEMVQSSHRRRTVVGV
ncbi:hypothetical protein Taro_050232 [Colocasia esculenta]|uniref:RanBP2-type domain-containing protein n=1 Tax=Colocasia esculenta TaxID=4460 RepID=A0A843XCW0_COLES|nr:hypothetical protein [Colocasia esculenta]